MSTIDELIRCDGCGTEITWSPFIVGKRVYCCEDCSRGIPCKCGERMTLEDNYRSSSTSTSTITVYSIG